MSYKYEVVILNDYARICEMMRQYGPHYDESDTDIFMQIDKTCYGMLYGGELMAFGCVIHHEGLDFVTYTWSNGTFSGKKAYVKLYDHILSIYNALTYGHRASQYNKVRRQQCVID